MDEWETWTPDWAPHVEGRYTRRVFDKETTLPEPQIVLMYCTTCDANWQVQCSSGLVRDHINNFARVHLHKDPLEAPRITRPGSLRRGTP